MLRGFALAAALGAVQAAAPMTTEPEVSYSSPSWSQAGFIDLQCPHQGARNLTNAALPDLKTRSSKLSDVSSVVAVVASSGSSGAVWMALEI